MLNRGIFRQKFTIYIPNTTNDAYGNGVVAEPCYPIYIRGHYEKYNRLGITDAGTQTVVSDTLWSASKQLSEVEPFGDDIVGEALRGNTGSTFLIKGHSDKVLVPDNEFNDSETQFTLADLRLLNLSGLSDSAVREYEYVPNQRGQYAVWRFTL